MVRDAVVAGQFYPGSSDSLLREVKSLMPGQPNKEDAIGLVSPHAGYMYSGPVAGSLYSAIKSKNLYLIMGPNHTGLGAPFAMAASDSWKTPLGTVEIDKALVSQIKKNSKHIREDELAHAHEHSVEVQLPFLQVLKKDFKFVPIAISYGTLAIYREIGRALAKSIKDLKLEKSVTIIASSDMTHYESQESAKKKDSLAIEAILKLDEEALMDNVTRFDISMCGYAPTVIMLVAAKELGATKARLAKYQTSGDAMGDYSSVVGYAGLIIS